MEKGYYEKIGYSEYKEIPPYRKEHGDPGCATVSQISCLMGLIKEYRFSDGRQIDTVVETGVNSGMSDLYMLKAGAKFNKKFKLYGIEIGTTNFYGNLVFNFATDEERQHWQFCKGQTVADIEKILPHSIGGIL